MDMRGKLRNFLKLFLISTVFVLTCVVFDLLGDLDGLSKVAIVKPYEPKLKIAIDKEKESKLILIWTKIPFFRREYFSSCLYKCNVTYNRKRIAEVDAVLFWGWSVDVKKLPLYRHAKQRWIFLLNESPRHTSLRRPSFKSKSLNGLFNWTVTYKHDSGVRIRFWKFVKKTENTTPIDYAAQKKRFALAVVSDCSIKERLSLIRQMQSYAPGLIDFYGKCGDCHSGKCGFKFTDYKFYLSFENSLHCRDYITEKFYSNALMAQSVPIAYGARKRDYLYSLPNRLAYSFIHVNDFDSVKSLVDYMLLLNANSTKYNQYHEWRNRFDIVKNKRLHFCKICEKLHKDKNEKIYVDFEKWFNSCENFYV